MEEKDKKCWQLGARPMEICRKCIVYINRVHCWKAPITKPRPCIVNYHHCVERKCPVFEKYRDRIMGLRL